MGFVSSLKDAFGFIESKTLDDEIFFHFSSASSDDFVVGDAVVYTEIQNRGSGRGGNNGKQRRKNAVNVRRLNDSERAVLETVHPDMYDGTILRGIRKGGGVIAYNSAPTNTAQTNGETAAVLGGDGSELPLDALPEKGGLEASDAAVPTARQVLFGASSIADSRGARPGDTVTFQVATAVADGAARAVDVIVTERLAVALETVVSSEERFTAVVGSVKGGKGYGFIAHRIEASNSDTLYFHISEVNGGEVLGPDDKVEFGVGERNGKPVAVSIQLLERSVDQPPTPRPQHLIRQRDGGGTGAARVGVLREPRGPSEGSVGFDGPVRGRGLALSSSDESIAEMLPEIAGNACAQEEEVANPHPSATNETH